ncbi:MAG: hypothetical protein AAF244_05300, partial [Pseudomonadota bacterium]
LVLMILKYILRNVGSTPPPARKTDKELEENIKASGRSMIKKSGAAILLGLTASLSNQTGINWIGGGLAAVFTVKALAQSLAHHVITSQAEKRTHESIDKLKF